ncbi:MAG: hypothetical protein CBE17_01780 [Gammaproteobacteria bacterium TMED257]|nr:MAG: hypothetical protein CBE17_01780 [Gammaproteobacteria bacterium TMED257]|tara:strand:+ start:790 stop:1746 length:957 start_codon:yes stop_codon:yes gene_type:complete
MKFALIILAYNESRSIKEVVLSHYDMFEKVIVVNDKSKDDTQEVLQELEHLENLIILNNKKNVGAGKSFEVGIKEFLKTECDYVIKVDGDNQFDPKDTFKILNIVKEQKFDYVKCDRFWSGGINGKIPFIRYLGNAFASFLIKFATGNWKINDALNGLFVISKDVVKDYKIPRIFNRYGYPFFLNSYVSNYAINNDILIAQYRNIISYRDEKSNLNPVTMFFKLIYYVIKNYFTKIKLKVRVSDLQISAIFDIFSIIMLVNTFYSVYKFISIRYFDMRGPQGTWFVVCLIFLILFVSILTLSQIQESKINKRKFTNLK